MDIICTGNDATIIRVMNMSSDSNVSIFIKLKDVKLKPDDAT